MAKLKCDTPTTKATMIGKSMKTCMETIKADLINTIRMNADSQIPTTEKAEVQQNNEL